MSNPITITPPLAFPDHWKIFHGPDGKSLHHLPLPTHGGARVRILVADDSAVCRKVLARALTHAGFDVIAVANGAEAIAELRKPDHPSIAILDWEMPEMDGVEICRRMRQAAKIIYLIIASSHDSMDEIIEGLEAGADDYLTKPVVTDELLAHIKVGLRVIGLQRALTQKIEELSALKSVSVAEHMMGSII